MHSPTIDTFEAALRSLPAARDALGAYPLSSEQKRLWLLAQLAGTATLPVTVRYAFTGTVDLAVVQQNLSAWIAHSESLRSLFVEVLERPVRLLMPTGLVKLEFFDRPPSDADMAELIGAAFELDKGPLLRAFITRTAAQQHELHLVGHPIVVDEPSLQRIAQTLFQTEPDHQYPAVGAIAEVFQREQTLAQDAQITEQWQQWGIGLQAPAATEIPTENPRPAIKGSDRQVHEALTAWGDQPVTEAEIVSSWLTVLMRWQGSQAALCAIKVRDKAHANLIGPLQTYLPVRVDMPDGSTLAQLRLQVEEQLNGNDHPSFSTLLEVCPPKRDLSRTPYFQTGLQFIAHDVEQRDFHAGNLTRLPTKQPSSDLDLFISCWVSDGTLGLTLDYDCAVLNSSQVEVLAQALISVLSAPGEQPIATVALMGQQMQQAVLAQAHGPRTTQPQLTLTEWVAASTEKSPLAVAVIDHGQQLSYAELWARAALVAANISQHVAKPRSIIAVALPRSAEFIAALLGVVRAGHAFLPIDPACGCAGSWSVGAWCPPP